MVEVGYKVISRRGDKTNGRTGTVISLFKGRVGVAFDNFRGHRLSDTPLGYEGPTLPEKNGWWVHPSELEVLEYPPQLKDLLFSLEEITECSR